MKKKVRKKGRKKKKNKKHSKAQQEILRIKMLNEYIRVLLDLIHRHKKFDPVSLKTRLSKKFSLLNEPKMVEIISTVPEEHRNTLLPYLKVKPVRTASGIAVVAIMCKPHRCPHIALTGNTCVYCPGGIDSDFEYSSQSYTGMEPTSMRAIRSRYNPFLQTKNRVDQLRRLGHDVDKVEFIVMGGTFMSLERDYRHFFIRNIHDALSGHCSTSVEEAISYGQESQTKCIGLTIETRPDYCYQSHLKDMLLYGCTRLEVGVQSIYEDVARDTNRGHSVRDIIKCFKLSKNCGIMPNLPQVDFERDLLQWKELFENPNFRPDGLKIYPTLVIRGTGLYEMWKRGEYKSYPPELLVDLVAKILSTLPPWTRIYRVARDIPMTIVSSGLEKGNLRQLAMKRLRDLGLKTKDIRHREVGIKGITEKVSPDEVELVRRDYYASGAWETFISYEDPENDVLIGLLRLRKLNQQDMFVKELGGVPTSMVRELHVYGSVVPVSARDPTKFQHKGYGALLMEEAERIARDEHGSKKIAVISGIGVRRYYFKLGYELDGSFVSKKL